MSFLSTIWSLASGGASKLFGGGFATYAAIAVLCFGAGVGVTWKIASWKEGAAQTAQAVSTVRIVERQDAITMNVDHFVIQTASVAQTRTQTIIKEVPQHVTSEIDRKYPVPLGFVRVWNHAAHGPVPGSAAGSDDAPSGVPLSDVAKAGVADEGTLDICRAQVKGWQDWYTHEKAAAAQK